MQNSMHLSNAFFLHFIPAIDKPRVTKFLVNFDNVSNTFNNGTDSIALDAQDQDDMMMGMDVHQGAQEEMML